MADKKKDQYRKHLAVVNRIREDGTFFSFAQLLDEVGARCEILRTDYLMELHPGNLKPVSEDQLDGESDLRVQYGVYSHKGNEYHFVELGLHIGKGIVNYNTLIYDAPLETTDLFEIRNNYMNILTAEESVEEVL